MDTNKDYEHPVLGQISDAEVELIAWDRRVQAEYIPKIKKLNEIIQEFNKIYEDWLGAIDSDTGQRVKRTTEKLEKFRDEEL